VSVLVSVGERTQCVTMHFAAQTRSGKKRKYRRFVASCVSVRFNAKGLKGIRNPMLYPLELRAHFWLNTMRQSTYTGLPKKLLSLSPWLVSVLVSVALTREPSSMGDQDLGCPRLPIERVSIADLPLK
jgi:hypothetical protein